MRYFEDCIVGHRRELGSYTFTRERIVAFAERYDPQPFHLDEEAGRRSLFGGLAASGWHTASVWMKMAVENGDREATEARARGESLPELGPSPGIRNLRWPRPVLADDTLTFFTEVASKRESASRPAWGLVFVLNTAVDQRGELALSFEGSAFHPRRTPGT